MSNNRVFICDVLTRTAFFQAQELSADKIICNEVRADVEPKGETEIVNAEVYRIEGTWNVYGYNSNIINTLFGKMPDAFCMGGISLKKACSKILYWTNVRTGALKVAYEHLPQPKLLLRDQPYLPGNYLKAVLKYFNLLLKNNIRYIRQKKSIPAFKGQYRTGILVNDGFELDLYSRIISAIPESDLAIFHYGNIHFSEVPFMPENAGLFNLSQIQNYAPQKLLNPFRLSREELIAANLICGEWQAIANELTAYRVMCDTGIKKLLVNVAENLPVRNLMPEVFKGRISVYNTMNGLKSGEAHDADVYFDKWFVWDKHMKEMMVKSCQIPAEKLIACGHLSQDRIAAHTYQNLLGIPLESMRNKLVLSIFSVRGNRKEKQVAFKLLYRFLSENQSVFLLVKPHPLEKPEDYILPPDGLTNVFFVPEELKHNKAALYDQLMLSDLTIVFGSTVALESQWMDVPCITFEFKTNSFVYSAGLDKISHVRTEEEFMNLLKAAAKKSAGKPKSPPGIAEKIAYELCK